MKRREFGQLLLSSAVAGSPLGAADEKPGSGSSQTPIPDTELALASLSSSDPLRVITDHLNIVLDAELNRAGEALLGLVHHFRMVELGISADPSSLPDKLVDASLSASALAAAFESSGVANEINAMLLEEGQLGFHKLRNPPDELCRRVSDMMAGYQPPDGLPQVDLPVDRVRDLLTISISPEEIGALHAYLSQGGSFTDFLRDGGKVMAKEALAKYADLRLPPAVHRTRSAPPIFTVNSEAERQKKADQIINGIALAAAVAALWCFITAGAACFVAIILALNAAGIRFLASLK